MTLEPGNSPQYSSLQNCKVEFYSCPPAYLRERKGNSQEPINFFRYHTAEFAEKQAVGSTSVQSELFSTFWAGLSHTRKAAH